MKKTPVEMKAADIPFATDGLSAETIYADSIRGTLVLPETAKINLVQNRINALTDEMNAVHVATVVVPTSQIAAWAQYLTQLSEEVAAAQVREHAPKEGDVG